MFLPARIDLKQRRRPPLCWTQQVREADGFPDMRISKSGKLTVSLTCESASPGSRCFQKSLDSAVNLSVITIIDSESIEMIDGRGPNVCVAISTIGVQSRFQGSLHPGRVNGKQG